MYTNPRYTLYAWQEVPFTLKGALDLSSDLFHFIPCLLSLSRPRAFGAFFYLSICPPRALGADQAPHLVALHHHRYVQATGVHLEYNKKPNMSYVMLPNSAGAIPKTTTERTTNENRQPTSMAMEDPEDEPGSEMSRGARVWKTYVRESDRWDKELVDGRNNSLDVLLIFAALFSAISTAFIIESLGDLKPDPVQSSAKTLLAISRNLAAMANAQPVTFLTPEDSDLDKFSPPRSAVIVNVLWLLSLSLSVAVSLIAMLAKEWCYKFMSNRSGTIYEQGRRRQQKWDGMEKWKMQEVLTHLPGLLHLALLLFAAGLCVYLWDIQLGVAIPVIVISSIATCVYMLATMLSFVDRFCPYTTPATPIFNFTILSTCRLAERVMDYMYPRVVGNKWFFSALEGLWDWIQVQSGNNNTPGGRDEDALVPMDRITSRMLAWMISNCEDTCSVDIALQAIAGARPELPHAELAKIDALYLVDRRMLACIQYDRQSECYEPKNANALRVAVRYCRAECALVSGVTYQCAGNSWAILETEQGEYRRGASWAYELLKVQQRYCVLDPLWCLHTFNCLPYMPSLSKHLNESQEDSIFFALGASVVLELCCWNWEGLAGYGSDSDRARMVATRKSAIQDATVLLYQYIHGKRNATSDSALPFILDSCTRYMVGYWPKLEQPRESPIPAMLVYLYLIVCDDAPDMAKTIAITLAASAFAIESYPGGEKKAVTHEDREMRAVRVLQHYRANERDVDSNTLFMFGLVGLLPHIKIDLLKPYSPIIARLYWRLPTTDSNLQGFNIPTLPESYSWTAHSVASCKQLKPVTTEIPEMHSSTFRHVPLLCLLSRSGLCHYQLYIPLLSILSQAQSVELQRTCISTLLSLDVVADQPQLSVLLEFDDMFGALFECFPWEDTAVAPAILFFFRVLIATLILPSGYDRHMRCSTLERAVDCKDEFKSLTPTNHDGAPPPEDSVLEHVAECINGDLKADSIVHTMQLVVNFLHAKSDIQADPKPQGPELENETPGWVAKLQEIKNTFGSRFSNAEPNRSPGVTPSTENVTTSELYGNPDSHNRVMLTSNPRQESKRGCSYWL